MKRKVKYYLLCILLSIIFIITVIFFPTRQEIIYPKEMEIKANEELPQTITYQEGNKQKVASITWQKLDESTFKGIFYVDKEYEVLLRIVNEGTINDKKIVGTTKKGYKIEQIDGLYYIDGILIANKTYALPSNYEPGGLLQELNIAFANLQEAAQKEGLEYKVVSGYRSYKRQNELYNNYVAKDGKALADTYSARPGHSEHQTGLAIDVNSLYVSFGETREGQWLKHNCYKYGFIIRYPEGKEDITGYMYEPWHLRYVGDIAEELYNNGDWITLEEYLGITSKY